jgi:AbrB family looped-hinge helix DNA binding protein
MTSKGQVTIPKRVRDYLGLKPGADVAFALGSNGRIELLPPEPPRAPANRFDALVGSAGPGMTTDELMALTRGWGEPDYDVK